jgi:hypothetical protein
VAERNVTVPPEPTRLEVFRRLVDAGDRLLDATSTSGAREVPLIVVIGRLHGTLREFVTAMFDARDEVRAWESESAASPEDDIEEARRRA